MNPSLERLDLDANFQHSTFNAQRPQQTPLDAAG
jgi:hypothetical protein